jgi:peptide chain release factor 1
MGSVIVEIRAAEGGDDAKELVHEQLGIYSRMGARLGLHYTLLESATGLVVFRAEGEGVERAFQNEPGGHRWQRVPPNERRGRVHTSTVTVAVLPEPTEQELHLDPRDLDIKTTRGSGPGGQARNKTESCVVITHKALQVTVRCDSERSQPQNRATAMALLRARIYQLKNDAIRVGRALQRKEQVGTGQRGDKIRTIRTQDGIVTDHRLGRKMRYERYEKGDLDVFQEEKQS